MNAQSHPIRIEDKHIGAQIKARRETLGLTQSNIAGRLGISFQQLQKYETGANRTSGSRLCDLAKILCCGPDYFFEGIGVAIETERMASREEAVMLGYMRGMGEEPRRALLDIAKQIADANAGLQTILNEKGRG